ncbi:thiopeptide-type bacteriocin biosynthesis protein [Streptomyces sp. SBC-4]|nr:thiopeptide-type bacteriocin biosynthesis protein [Streptomyces sp. SBC-4]MDV5143426.1 thiopeptide-type bacteriocin biosynthesis protein [Streptomyces sp. SBC-4]
MNHVSIALTPLVRCVPESAARPVLLVDLVREAQARRRAAAATADDPDAVERTVKQLVARGFLFDPNAAAALNLAQLPDVLTRQLPVGLYPEAAGPDFIDWRDLALVAQSTPPRPAPVLRPDGPELSHRPGGEWLYARINLPCSAMNEALTRHLPGLVNDLHDRIDRWFFVRYTDRDPHLCIRFHGEPHVLAGALPSSTPRSADFGRRG